MMKPRFIYLLAKIFAVVALYIKFHGGDTLSIATYLPYFVKSQSDKIALYIFIIGRLPDRWRVVDSVAILLFWSSSGLRITLDTMTLISIM